MKPATLLALLVCQWAAASTDCSVIHAGKLFDGKSNHYLSNVQILIRGERITHVGKSVAAPKRCRNIDLSRAVILPGLIDAHTHLLTIDRSSAREFPKELLRIASEKDETRLAESRRRARALLSAGITTVRDLGNSGQYLDLKLRDEVRRGELPGPRIFGSGPGLAVKKAQFPRDADDSLVSREYSLIRSEGEIQEEIERHFQAGADLIKIYADNDPSEGAMPPAWLSRAVRLAHAHRLKVAVHATTQAAVAAAAEAGADSIEHLGEVDEEILSKLSKRKIFAVPTDFSRKEAGLLGKRNPDYAHPDFYLEKRSRILQQAIRAGVSIAFGSDAYVDFSSDGIDAAQAVKEALYSYADQGMKNAEILKAATVNAARLLGHADLGVIRPGAKADLIAVSGDPLSEIRDLDRISFVMKDGKLVPQGR